MNCKCIFTIFKSIINFNYFTWQFIWLSNRSKTNLKRISYWTTYDKSSCLWSNDDFCTLFFGKFNDLVHRIFKCFTVCHYWTDIFKFYSSYRPIINNFNIIFKLHVLFPSNYFYYLASYFQIELLLIRLNQNNIIVLQLVLFRSLFDSGELFLNFSFQN